VSSTAPDGQIESKLDHKLFYDRIGYDNAYNFVDVSVKDGVADFDGYDSNAGQQKIRHSTWQATMPG